MIAWMSIHEGTPVAPHDVFGAWLGEPMVILPLAATAVAWVAGRRTVQIDRWRSASAIAGWAVMVLALGPLHAAATALFSAHMAQHVLLMTVAVPLLVLGRPLGPLLNAVPAWRPAMTRVLRRRWVTTILQPDPLFAWSLHAVVLWVWHLPGLYGLSLSSETWHAIQHLTFLVAAVVYWQSVLRGRHAGSTRWAAIAVASLFTTALHATALGAFLTLADAPFYRGHMESTAAWGLTPLEDQQLAGLIMWVPGCLPYLVAGVALFASLLREPRRRAA
jgi:putative membrane protein